MDCSKYKEVIHKLKASSFSEREQLQQLDTSPSRLSPILEKLKKVKKKKSGKKMSTDNQLKNLLYRDSRT
jgi:hypothetical protein